MTYEWAQKARVFVPSKPFQPFVMQCSSLMDPFHELQIKMKCCMKLSEQEKSFLM